MARLSVLIPARHEEFLQQTIDDVFEHAAGDTEVLVALDNWDNPPEVHVKHGQVITTKAGQRGATNELAKLSTADYVMKLDAHCSLSPGFDVEMMKLMDGGMVLVPALHNLHAYDWFCEKGHRHFQGAYDKCDQCGSTDLRKQPVFQIIPKPSMTNYYFDTTLHFQYSVKQSFETINETMSIQGSCFMAPRELYHRLNLCDEAFGSWGQQGTEVACKTWLSGGRVLSTRAAWYGHQFRIPGEFPNGDSENHAFPYPNPSEKILAAQKFSRDLFLGNKWPLQTRPIQWLIERFGYQGDWTPEKVAELCAQWGG